MHELSIAYSLVETATAAARANDVSHVAAVQLKLGQLSGVCKESLLFAFDLATAGSLLAGATLSIEEIPVRVFCPTCGEARTVPDIQYLCCPVCDTPAGQIIRGKEIELVSLTCYEQPETA